MTKMNFHGKSENKLVQIGYFNLFNKMLPPNNSGPKKFESKKVRVKTLSGEKKIRSRKIISD